MESIIFKVGDLVELRPDWERPATAPRLRPNARLAKRLAKMKWPARIVNVGNRDLITLEGLGSFINSHRLRLVTETTLAQLADTHKAEQDNLLTKIRMELGIDPVPADGARIGDDIPCPKCNPEGK